MVVCRYKAVMKSLRRGCGLLGQVWSKQVWSSGQVCSSQVWSRRQVWRVGVESSRKLHTTSRRSQQVTWLHPAGPTIERLHVSAQYCQNTQIIRMVINSTVPLTQRHFHQALTHLYRKMPHLRTNLRTRDGVLWVCESEEVQLDFQVLEGADHEAEVNRLVVTPFPNAAQDPMWRARLIPCPPNAPCKMPEVQEKYPHQSILLAAFHHGAADGLSTSASISALMTILNQVILNQPVNHEQLGTLVGEGQTMRIQAQVEEEMERNPEEFERLMEEAKERMNFQSLLSRAFGPPSDDNRLPSDYVETDLDAALMIKFQAKCRANKVTINSGINAVVATALVELVTREGGLEDDVFNITTRHAISTRRYWGGDPLTTLGSHLGAVTHHATAARDNFTHLWQYAARFEREFRQKLDNGHIFRERIVNARLLPKHFDLHKYFQTVHPPVQDFYISNMFLPHFFRYGMGGAAQLTHESLMTNVSRQDFTNFHLFKVFRDRPSYHIIFSPNRLDRWIVQRFLDRIVDVLNRSVS